MAAVTVVVSVFVATVPAGAVSSVTVTADRLVDDLGKALDLIPRDKDGTLLSSVTGKVADESIKKVIPLLSEHALKWAKNYGLKLDAGQAQSLRRMLEKEVADWKNWKTAPVDAAGSWAMSIVVDTLVGKAIDWTSDRIGEASGSFAARGFSWLALNEAYVGAKVAKNLVTGKSKGFVLVNLAIEQTALLYEVGKKVEEEREINNQSQADAIVAGKRAKLEAIYLDHIVEYLRSDASGRDHVLSEIRRLAQAEMDATGYYEHSSLDARYWFKADAGKATNEMIKSWLNSIEERLNQTNAVALDDPSIVSKLEVSIATMQGRFISPAAASPVPFTNTTAPTTIETWTVSDQFFFSGQVVAETAPTPQAACYPSPCSVAVNFNDEQKVELANEAVPTVVVVPPPSLVPASKTHAGYASAFGFSPPHWPSYGSGSIETDGKPAINGSKSFSFDTVGPVSGNFTHNASGSYDHVKWGQWSGGKKTYYRASEGITFKDLKGRLVYGELAPSMPKIGIGYFKGDAIGDWFAGSSEHTFHSGGIQGEFGLAAHFSTNKIDGWMSFYKTGQPGAPWRVVDVKNVSINRQGGHVSFEGDLKGADDSNGSVRGGMQGAFYGPTGNEIGGAYWLDALDDSAGVFAGRRTTSSDPKLNRPADPPPPPSATDPVYGGHIAGLMTGGNGAFTNEMTGVAYDTAPLSVGLKTLNDHGSVTRVNVAVTPASFKGASGAANDVYKYTAWGAWGKSDYIGGAGFTKSPERGYFVFGRQTDDADMPRSGTATYNGDVLGVAFGGQTINGTSRFVADFARNSIDGELKLKLASGAAWLNMKSEGMSISGTSFGDQSVVVKTPSGANMTGAGGNMFGEFYGTNGQEIAGQYAVWGATGPGGSDGIFRAKK